MQIQWIIDDEDIHHLKEFVSIQNNPFVALRISKNVNHENIRIDKDSIIKGMLMCLLTSQQRSGPESTVSRFFKTEPFPITYQTINDTLNLEENVKSILLKHGLRRYQNRIAEFFAKNIQFLEKTQWALIDTLKSELLNLTDKQAERKIADSINDSLAGFGPKQSRNLLQSLGVSKFEIPIDSRITQWLNQFGFPVILSPVALQDRGYYHFVMDGIQHICEKAEIFPCVLDAAIFSSYDEGRWTEENIVY